VERVTGIGGVFIRSARPDELRAWYAQHLGFDVNEEWGGGVVGGAGVEVDDRVEELEFGRFGCAVDPDGNRVELWEPTPGH
jgi:catechol 2,3-dioxygenase-like lactoylglutathione lyase family enzyme